MISLHESTKLALAEIVGAGHCHFDRLTIDRYARTTGFKSVPALAIILPDSAQEVQALVRLANQHKFSLYPTSCGKNWGYGDGAPPRTGQVVLDLSRMNRIIHVDPKLCYAVIEPGVTQGQLSQYLARHHPELWMDSTGAGASCSLIGNFSDRGFGHTRYSDHYLSCSGLQVVLGTGELLETGFGHYSNAQAKHVFKWGVGPILDGLFSQSNFGIITQAGLYLMPQPEDYCVFIFGCKDDCHLQDTVDILGVLKRQGILQSAVHIANDLRAFSGAMRYPWEAANNCTPLSDNLRNTFRKRFGIGAWTGTGIITGPPEVVKAYKKLICRGLAACKPQFFSKKQIMVAHSFTRLMDRLGKTPALVKKLKLLKPVADMLVGLPSNEALPGACWRVKSKAAHDPQSYDPLDHQAGLAWISPILPMTGDHVEKILSHIPSIYKKYSFDFLATFTLINERSLVLVSNVAFDRSNEKETHAAQECYNHLLGWLMHEGYVPYRLSPSSAHTLASHSSEFWQVAAKIKCALDPNNVISPGRYEVTDGIN
jgi:4-cresol dehydrogenase (hydroxylating)